MEQSDVEEVQGLVDLILKSDPSAQEVRRPAAARKQRDEAAGAKRGASDDTTAAKSFAARWLDLDDGRARQR